MKKTKQKQAGQAKSLKDVNTKTWKPDGSDVNETREVFYYDINILLNKINKYWYADKAPNQSVRLLRTVLKECYFDYKSISPVLDAFKKGKKKK